MKVRVTREGSYRGEWEVSGRWFHADWAHFNPEYTYRRVLHVRIGGLVFSVGWCG